MANLGLSPDIEGLVGTPTGPFGVGTGMGIASLPASSAATWSKTWLMLEPGFATKMRKVFAILTSQGYSPRIADSWRDPSTQAALKAAGRSKVDWSFHNAVDDNGKPAALAADIIDSRYGYEESDRNAAFFKALGAAGESVGMTWGGGLTYKRSNSTWAHYGLSWDPSHLQALPNGALGQIRAQSEAVWRALRRGNVAALPGVIVTGWWRVVTALPAWYWATLAAVTLLVVVKLKRRRRAISMTSIQ